MPRALTESGRVELRLRALAQVRPSNAFSYGFIDRAAFIKISNFCSTIFVNQQFRYRYIWTRCVNSDEARRIGAPFNLTVLRQIVRFLSHKYW
jgi:hypothetical protein